MAIYQMRFELGRPRYGWVAVKLETDQPILNFRASSSTNDPIGELAEALAAVLKGTAAKPVLWHGETDKVEMHLARDQDHIVLAVIQQPGSQPSKTKRQELLRVRGKPRDVALPFWRALQRLQSQMPAGEYKIAWGHTLASAKLAELTALVQQFA